MRTESQQLPPGPRLPLPIQTAIWTRHAQWLLAQCRRRYGDTFTLRIAYEPTWVVTCDPELVKAVFTGDPKVLHAGEGNSVLGVVLGNYSVLLLDEEEHMRQRKLLLPPFHGARMQRYGELIADLARREIEGWPKGTTIKARPLMQRLTLEVILRAVFGVEEGERLTQLRDRIRDLLSFVTDPRRILVLLLAGPGRIHRVAPLKRRLQAIDDLLYAEIAKRRGEDLSEREDIMSLLLQATHDDGSPMSDQEIRDELMTLLLAGHETTANALAWALERLSHCPERLERLREELDGGEDRYLKAVVYETLRLRPVISIVVRKLTAPFQLGPYHLPAGVAIVPSIYLMHRREEIYPQPEEFIPERFLDRPPGTYTWIPFGGGVRRCLGAAFAQFEMETVLRELLTNYDLKPGRPQGEPVLRRSITETPARDAEVIVTPRTTRATGPAPALSGASG
jgi:cytochrome P450